MKFLKILEEQVALDFSGIILIYQKEASFELGFISLRNAKIVGCNYRGYCDYLALSQFIEDEYFKPDFFVYDLSPKSVALEDVQFNWSFSQFVDAWKKEREKIQKIKEFKPPPRTKISINRDFIKDNQENLSPNEFKILCTLVDYHYIEDINRQCDLLEGEIVYNLINLRKRGALRILPSSEESGSEDAKAQSGKA